MDVRAAAAADLRISDKWVWMHQVHGGAVARVDQPGSAGEADALVTDHAGLPLAVRTADCVPVVIHASAGVAVVHAGWRGLAAGVVRNAVAALAGTGDVATRAAIGPSIGPCCYEVGSDVIGALGGREARTTWGTPSVDLRSEAARQLVGLDVWRSDQCSYCESGFHSYRATGTPLRQTTVGWL